MREKLNIRRYELLYFLAYFLFGFSSTVITNSYLFGNSAMRLEIVNYMNYLTAAMFASAFCLRPMQLGNILKRVGICLVALAVTANLRIISFGVSILAIIAAVDIEFKKIVKWCIGTNVFYLVIVIIPSLIEIIPNETYIHYDAVAYCLGFVYYSNVPYIVLMLTIMSYWMAKNKKEENIILFIGTPIQYVIYRISTVRLVFYLYILFICFAITIRIVNFKKENHFKRILSFLMFPCAFLCTVIVSLKVNTVDILLKLDKILNWRFSFNYRGFHEYGIKFLGQKIETVANDTNYFYIDSGYIFSLLSYGIALTCIILAAYSILSYNVVKKEDKKLFVWCTIICVFSIINNIWLNICINPLPILAVNMLINYKKNLE